MSLDLQTTTSKWINGIAVPAATNNSFRLFCFPHAGGGASAFHPWMTQHLMGVEIFPIQFPGREGRWLEPRLTQMSEVISALVTALSPLLHHPYAFFGHSMGAFVAFELTRELRRRNQPLPKILIMSGARAPHVPDPDPPMHDLPPDALLEDLKRLRGIPDEILNQKDFLSLLLPILRSDLSVCETYEYNHESPLDCAISVYGGEADTKARPEHLALWKTQTSQEFRLRIFPGDHFFFIKESDVAVREALCDDLNPFLPQPEQSDGSPGNHLEQIIAGIWEDLLRLPQVGLDENFFELGANSLLIIQAHGKLREASINTLSVLDLFQYPTVRLLASAIGTPPNGLGNDMVTWPRSPAAGHK
jgi:medium-chain acyl-[acyl-carrier-protein] hydrolase